MRVPSAGNGRSVRLLVVPIGDTGEIDGEEEVEVSRGYGSDGLL